jgi:hypothetical protein
VITDTSVIHSAAWTQLPSTACRRTRTQRRLVRLPTRRATRAAEAGECRPPGHVSRPRPESRYPAIQSRRARAVDVSLSCPLAYGKRDGNGIRGPAGYDRPEGPVGLERELWKG